MDVVEFKVENYERIVKKYEPLINKSAYLLYQQYHTVIDFEDAKQEVLMCMWRCLLKYDPKKYKFMTYFYCSMGRLRSRFYYSYFHAINIASHEEQKFINNEGQKVHASTNTNIDDERFIDQNTKYNIRPRLTPESKEVYDVFMSELRISPWLVSRTLNISRYHGKERYNRFRSELAVLCGFTS